MNHHAEVHLIMSIHSMKQRDIKILMLMEAVSRGDCHSQRALAKKLHISLGLVNASIHELERRGVFKIKKSTLGRHAYGLTDKGMAEKNRLKMNYISYSLAQYSEIKCWIGKIVNKIHARGIRDIILYQATELCEIICNVFAQNAMGTVTVVDNDQAGRKICGVEIINTRTMCNLDYDAVIITDLYDQNRSQKRLVAAGIPRRKIYTIFSIGTVVD
jgi:DNA-binding Lrp family transcriptional regulator